MKKFNGFWRSLQTCQLNNNVKILDDAIERVSKTDLLGHLKGAKAILEMLLCVTTNGDGISRRKSSKHIDRAFEIFLSYSDTSFPEEEFVNTLRKLRFKEFICGEKYGLCVYIVRDYVVLRPDDVDLDHLFLCFSDMDLCHKESVESNFMLRFDDVLESVETEWDRKVVKVVAGAFCSPSEIHEIPGIRHRSLKEMTREVLYTIDFTEEVVTSAEQAVDHNLGASCTELGEKLVKMGKKRKNMVLDWPKEKVDELDDDIEDLQKRLK